MNVGFCCAVCGYSDTGIVRLMSFGFTPHPCPSCVDHFRPVLPPEQDPNVEGSLSPHPPEAPTDTPHTYENGTLW